MKRILFILIVSFITSFLPAQSNSGGAVGIRIGSGSSGKINVTTDEGVAMVGYMIYDENGNLVQSGSLSSTAKTSVNVNSLESGVYFIVVVSENGDTGTSTFVKD